MPASLIGSLLVFVLTGIYAIKTVENPITGVGFADAVIYVTIMVNAIYFYYFEAYAEIDDNEHARLVQKPCLEWVIRVINHGILISLWIALEGGLWRFLGLLISFYVLILFWDFLTYDWSPSPTNITPVGSQQLPKWDIYGFWLTIVSAAIVFLLNEIKNDGDYYKQLTSIGVMTDVHDAEIILVLALGFICAFYIALVCVAYKKVGFRLRDHFRRPNLR
jgi:hypothetical protein